MLRLMLAAGALMASGPAFAGGVLPTGGQYIAGQGSISGSTNGLTVTQTTSHGIVTWGSFSIGANNTVQFNNGTGATLNWVTGGNISQINGRLNATGSLYLINPQGVVIGPGGKVVTNGSFVASTRDVDSNAFMSGGPLAANGTSNGDVVNAGTITSNDGDAILVGRSVTNSGTMTAPNGTASLAAGNQIVLQPVGGDSRIAVAGGTGDATNSGTIKAAQAALAAAGGNVYALAENGAGVVSATGTKTVDGHVWLTANSGTAQVSGSVAAQNADGSGGTVTVRASNIGVPGTVDASAQNAGHAGGQVSIVATGTTAVTGTIQARGGVSGQGGTIETSGHRLAVGGAQVDAGAGGQWLLDPFDLTVDAAAASTIDGSLGAGTSVTLQTTATGTSGPGNANASGNGNIVIDSAIAWSTAATLTLDAYNGIAIDAPITVAGAGKVNLIAAYDTTTVPGTSLLELSFGQGDSINYGATNNGGSLTIDGQAYALLYALAQAGSTGPDSGTADIAGIDHAGDAGFYALATNLDGTGTVFTSPLAGAGSNNFTGVFEGLGNTISNLAITSGAPDVGLFEVVGAAGSVTNVGLINASVTGTSQSFGAGALVGQNHGVVSGANTSGTVTLLAVFGTNAGGLVGDNYGAITGSYSTAAVTGGDGENVGGLVGFNEIGASIIDSSAAGNAVGGNGAAWVGGLAGYNGGTITASYSTGSAMDGGANVGGAVGGLVGYNDSGSQITKAYAMGAVSGTGVDVGGLVGANLGGISDAYSIGSVKTTAGFVGGGLVGGNQGGAIAAGYWDTQTSGTTTSAGGTGQTTAWLQGTLPGGFSNTVWGTGTGLFPYFLWQYPGTPQAVSGIAYSNGGGTVLDAGTVSLLANGTAEGTVSTGANGYYYEPVAPGTLAVGTAVLLEETGGGNGARLGSLSGTATGIDIWNATLIAPTSRTTYSSASANVLADDATLLSQAIGSNTAANNQVGSLTNFGFIASGNFTVDQALTLSDGLFVQAAGDITVADALTLPGTNALTLNSGGTLAIGAPVTVTGAGAVNLSISSLSFDLESGGFAGDIQFTGTPNSGQSLAINGTHYTLLYSMSDVQAIDNNPAGAFALATGIDAGGTTYAHAPVSAIFLGTFEGLGNTIANLTISSGNPYVGLFAYSRGTIANIGLAGGVVTGGGETGALAGVVDGGAIVYAYETAAVSGGNAGGLVGVVNAGTIIDSYAAGAVSGSEAGGLIGAVNGGTIASVYATGAVSSSGGYAGGLVGVVNGGTITNTYATGAVSGGNAGALVGGGYGGYLSGDTVSNSYATGTVNGMYAGGLLGQFGGTSYANNYWNIQTTGHGNGFGLDDFLYWGGTFNGSGLTTAQLQGALPGGFSNAVWGTGPGLYPYFLWQYPNGTPQAVSGIAHSNGGGTVLQAGTVSLLANGANFGTVSTGANGYYYELLAPGTISSGGTAVLAYETGANSGARVATLTGTSGGFDIWGNTLIAPTTGTSYSTASATSLQTQDSALIASAVGSNADPTAGLTNYGYIAPGNFNVDQALTLSNGLYVQAAGNITVANALTLPGSNGLTLAAGGALAIDAPVAVTGAGVRDAGRGP